MIMILLDETDIFANGSMRKSQQNSDIWSVKTDKGDKNR